MMFNKTATYLRRGYYQQFEEGSDLGGAQAQDVESRIEQALFGSDDADADDDAVLDDGQADLPEGDDAEADDDAEVDDEVDPDAEPEGEADDDDQTLASVLGIDDDKLAYDEEGNVVFNAVIDGEQQQVKMQDLVKSYQLEGHVNNKSIKLENDRKEFEGTRDKAYTELANRLESANQLLELATQSLTSEFQGIDWESLRMSDPAEWAALRQQFQERAQQIEQAKSLVGQNKGQLTEEQQQQEMQQRQQFMEQEINKMIADNPSWTDQNVMAKEVGEIGTFLNSEYGFSPEEVAGVMDSRLMRLVQDARNFRSGKQAAQKKKIPDNIPKFRKPGSNNGNREQLAKARKVKAQKQAIRKTGGSVDAVAAAIADRM